MKNAFLIGEKIYLRPLERDDAAACKEYINDPDVRRNLDTVRPKSIPFEEAWIEGQSRDANCIVLGIALQESDRLIGATDLRDIHPANRSATFGITIGAKDEWNKGHGTDTTRLMLKYGFDTLNLNRIDLSVYATNPGGLRAYEKAGFVREGTLRQKVFREGRYIDVYILSALRDEWKE